MQKKSSFVYQLGCARHLVQFESEISPFQAVVAHINYPQCGIILHWSKFSEPKYNWCDSENGHLLWIYGSEMDFKNDKSSIKIYNRGASKRNGDCLQMAFEMIVVVELLYKCILMVIVTHLFAAGNNSSANGRFKCRKCTSMSKRQTISIYYMQSNKIVFVFVDILPFKEKFFCFCEEWKQNKKKRTSI